MEFTIIPNFYKQIHQLKGQEKDNNETFVFVVGKAAMSKAEAHKKAIKTEI